MAEHLFTVKWQPYKSPILLIIHPYVRAVLLVAFIVVVVSAEFTIADLRVLDGFEQFGTKKIAWEKISHGWRVTVIGQKLIDDFIV